MANNKELKCATCGTIADSGTLYKLKLKSKLYFFCSEGCKIKFESKHGIYDEV